MSRAAFRFTIACALIASTLAAAAASAGAPPALRGRWVVSQVAVDRNDTIRRSHEPNDPRLMGNVLDILADGTLDPTRQDCKAARWQARRATPLAASVARQVRESSGQVSHPTLADYGLALGNPKLLPQAPSCAGDSGKREAFEGGTWFAALAPDRMIEVNGVDTVLVYDRITAATPVRPSFDCATAKGESAGAICKSQILAGLDRSVALALQRADKRGGAGLAEDQAAWLRERDACKADEACLTQKMGDRIDALMQR